MQKLFKPEWVSKTRLDALKHGFVPRPLRLHGHIAGYGTSRNIYHHIGNTVRKEDSTGREKKVYRDIREYVKDDEDKKHLLHYIPKHIDDPDYPHSIILENLSKQGFVTFDKFPKIIRGNDRENELRKLCQELKQVVKEFLKHGIIHRDGKPENVMIKKTEEGWKVKIIDFEIVEISDNMSEDKKKEEYEQYMYDFIFDANYEENNFVYLRENIKLVKEVLESY